MCVPSLLQRAQSRRLRHRSEGVAVCRPCPTLSQVGHLRHPLRPLGQSLVVVASKLVAVVQGVQGELLLGEEGLALYPERLAFKRVAHALLAHRVGHDEFTAAVGGGDTPFYNATPPYLGAMY